MRALLCLFSLVALPALAVGLNDTGIDFCHDGSSNTANCTSVFGDSGTDPGQDARYGRDAAAAAGKLPKIGGGEAGFDLSALNASGQVMATPGSAASPHSCVRDNLTGLVWEVKTADGGLRDQKWTYSWYSAPVGTASGGTCKTAGRCDSEKYTADVNASALCGFSDWRMPSVDELQDIVHYGRVHPSIEPAYFPNTPAYFFWSASPSAPNPAIAWVVDFSNGGTYASYLSSSNHVRLVRSGQ